MRRLIKVELRSLEPMEYSPGIVVTGFRLLGDEQPLLSPVMNLPVLFASALATSIGVVVVLLGVVVFLIINNAKSSMTLNLSSAHLSSGENVEGTVSIATGKDLHAERLVVSLVGVYEETRRRPRSTAGYDENEDQWDSTATEVFRHDEELTIELPVPKKFKGDIPFSFPAPLGGQVTVKTPSGGIRQGAEIPVGDLPGSGTASLNWTLTAILEGTNLEPQSQPVEVSLT